MKNIMTKIYANFMEEHIMFGRNAVEYSCEIKDIEKLRDFMECAHRYGYQCKYTVNYIAGEPYYVITVGVSRWTAERLAIDALSDKMNTFHKMRNKERNAEIEDARRDGYAKAVEDMALNSRD